MILTILEILWFLSWRFLLLTAFCYIAFYSFLGIICLFGEVYKIVSNPIKFIKLHIFQTIESFSYGYAKVLGFNSHEFSKSFLNHFGLTNCYVVPGPWSFQISKTAFISKNKMSQRIIKMSDSHKS